MPKININSFRDELEKIGTAKGIALGALGGALLGTLNGYMASNPHNGREYSPKQKKRNAIIGAISHGMLGAGMGHMLSSPLIPSKLLPSKNLKVPKFTERFKWEEPFISKR